MRLIDADELLKKAKIRYHEDLYGAKAGGYTLLYADVESEPTIDAVPVVHGKWIDGFICSECKMANSRNGDTEIKFCGYCGARLEG